MKNLYTRFLYFLVKRIGLNLKHYPHQDGADREFTIEDMRARRFYGPRALQNGQTEFDKPDELVPCINNIKGDVLAELLSQAQKSYDSAITRNNTIGDRCKSLLTVTAFLTGAIGFCFTRIEFGIESMVIVGTCLICPVITVTILCSYLRCRHNYYPHVVNPFPDSVSPEP